MPNYPWPPAPAAVIGAEAGSTPTQYGKQPDIIFDPSDWVIPGGPFDAGTINDMIVAIEDLADVVNELGELLDSNYVPIVIDINGSGDQSYPPNYNPAYGDGVRANMQQYVGDSWDGSTAGVTMITSWETSNGTSPPPGAPAGWDGDIGPGGAHPARGNTWKFKLPHNGEVYSSKFSFNKSVNGLIQVNLVPSSDTNWQNNGYVAIVWMSSTPGGNPHMGYDGNPHMYKFDNDTASNFGTYYDRDLISVGKGLSEKEGIITTAFGAQVLRQTRAPYGGITWQPYMLSSGGDYVFPVIEKTYFLNWAMVLSSKASTVLERGTPPTASERKPLTGLSNQYGFMQMVGAYDVGNTHVYTLNNYLEKTRYKLLDSHRGYIGIDETMADFMWDSDSSFLSDSDYTPISSGDITLNTSDIGFEGEYYYENSIWSGFNYKEADRVQYVIPQDGKLATTEFTMAYGTGLGDTYYDDNNSTFDLSWLPHNDNKTRAWYDLGLTPVMWMSAEPGGEPQPIHDKSRGVVIAIPAQGVTYEGQQIASTTEVQFLGSTGGTTRATFPITNHKYYINVGVVETAVATQLEATGVAPTASQLRSWSINDASLDYTPTTNQLMYLNGRRNYSQINGSGS